MSANATMRTEPFSRTRERGRDEGAPRSGVWAGRTAPALTPALSRKRDRGNSAQARNVRPRSA